MKRCVWVLCWFALLVQGCLSDEYSKLYSWERPPASRHEAFLLSDTYLVVFPRTTDPSPAFDIHAVHLGGGKAYEKPLEFTWTNSFDATEDFAFFMTGNVVNDTFLVRRVRCDSHDCDALPNWSIPFTANNAQHASRVGTFTNADGILAMAYVPTVRSDGQILQTFRLQQVRHDVTANPERSVLMQFQDHVASELRALDAILSDSWKVVFVRQDIVGDRISLRLSDQIDLKNMSPESLRNGFPNVLDGVCDAGSPANVLSLVADGSDIFWLYLRCGTSRVYKLVKWQWGQRFDQAVQFPVVVERQHTAVKIIPKAKGISFVWAESNGTVWSVYTAPFEDKSLSLANPPSRETLLTDIAPNSFELSANVRGGYLVTGRRASNPDQFAYNARCGGKVHQDTVRPVIVPDDSEFAVKSALNSRCDPVFLIRSHKSGQLTALTLAEAAEPHKTPVPVPVPAGPGYPIPPAAPRPGDDFNGASTTAISQAFVFVTLLVGLLF